jgi:amino acid adenylation domain-containing protein
MEPSNLIARLANLSPAKRALFELRLKQKVTAGAVEQRIPRRTTREPIPLSFGQQRLWFLNQLEPESPFYNEAKAIRLIGALDVEALRKALDKIVARHEVLRTNFVPVDGNPVQIVADSWILDLPVIDLKRCSDAARDVEVQRLLQATIERPFDLFQDLKLRALLIAVADGEHIFVTVRHHVASDGWSSGIFWRELAAFYEAFSKGTPNPLPDLPIQYADYAVWQRQRLQGEILKSQLGYWKEQLSAIPVLRLPTDRPRPAIQSYEGAKETLVFSETLSDQLKALSRSTGVTLFMTLLAAFQTLLYRYTGQEDIAVGSPIAGRTRSETEGLIGFFVNTLVLRTDLSGDPSFRELLARVRAIAIGAYERQDVPFEKLVEELNPERNLGQTPLFQVMFALQSVPVETLEIPSLTVSSVEIDRHTTKFDLFLAVSEEPRGLEVRAEYSTDLFDAATIERMLSHFRTLLDGIVANPEQRISELPILTEAEKHQLLVEWNNTAIAHPKDKCIHELFEAQVEKSAEAVAVIFEEQKMTYRELNQRANQLAHYLQSFGVGPETMVGVCLERSIEMIVALLGILKAGGGYVPLDPEYPKERLRFMLDDTRIPVLLTQQKLIEKLPACSARTVCLDRDREEIASESKENPENEATTENLAYVIYTSGSTGKPKGVMIEHGSTAAFLFWAHNTYTPQDLHCVLASTSICFDLSIFEIFAPLTSGAKVVLAENAITLPELPDHLEITLINTVPSAINELTLFKRIPASVQTINLAGERLSTKLVQQIFEKTHANQVFDLYGPSEATTYSTWTSRTADGPETIGRPILNTQIYILDNHLNLMPIGVPGEIYVGGAGLARGYWNRPELTAEKFIVNPYSNGSGTRLYKTGDLGCYLRDGNIEFLGRIDNQVKVRGYRIELGEIEEVLGQHPGVHENAVIVREDTPDDKRLVAYVVQSQDRVPAVNELRSFLKQKLPEYMVPSAIVALDALPLMPNGKVNRNGFPAPDQSRPELEQSYQAPRTPAEEMLVEIWAEVLKLNRIGIHDNFFDLGGHSLLATQVISRIRRALQVEMPLRSCFEIPTIAGLAERVNQIQYKAQGLQIPPLLPVSRKKDLPLSFAQQRLWFLDRLTPGSTTYNVPGALRIRGALDITALQQSLDEIIRRHETLRTTFSTKDAEVIQIVWPLFRLPLPVVDLSDHVQTEREEEARHLIKQEVHGRFDLERGPLLRATLIRLSHEEHVLLLTMHHIVSDGWSIGVLYRELSALYQALSNGKTSSLPDLPIQYGDFAVWQREWLRGEVLETQLAYWKKQLEGIPAVLQLPTDRPRPAVQSFRGARESIELSKELTDGLKALSRQHDVTLFMTLLAAFQTLLRRYTEQDDIVVGSPIANRNRTEIENLIGFFVNTLVLRSDLSGDPTFTEVLSRIREGALRAYAHQDLPFEKLVEELQPKRDLSYSPLFQVMFVLQNAPDPAREFEGLTLRSFGVDGGTAKFDLTLSMQEEAEGLRGSLEYNTDLFDAVTVERMLIHFQVLLEGIVADSERRISELPLLNEAERQQLLVEWNDTARDYPNDKCIHDLFEVQVENTPDAVAVVFEDHQLRYKELNHRANQLAHYLARLGVGAETPVGICMERSIELVVALLGILKTGGAYVPLDPSYPKARLAFMLEDTQAPVLLTQQKLVENLPAQNTQVVCLDRHWDEIARESKENPRIKVSPENLAYVIYTSGSTGRPKGVEVLHRGVVRLLFGVDYVQLDSSQSFLHLAPTSFDASTFEIWGALVHGAKCILCPGNVPSPTELGDLLHKHEVSTLWLTASLFDAVIDEAPEALSAVGQLLIGGEALSVPHVRRALALLPATKIINGYGPTESTTFTCCYPIPRQLDEAIHAVPIGRPIGNTSIYILDQELNPVPIGIPGEIYIGGAGLARGYLNRAELTAEKFIVDPFRSEAGARLYRTGDRARYLSDGNIEFLGRLDDQVKIRGYRIEPGEIESALIQHPAVNEAIVLAREVIAGDPSVPRRTDKRLVAYVAAAHDSASSAHELRGFLRQRLPDYMIPSSFIFLKSLPLTPNGKIDRRALPSPEPSCANTETGYVPPRSELEKTLATSWTEVLGVERVGIHDNFFDLGGHSLLAVRLLAQIEKVSGKNLPLSALFRAPTVEQLAGLLLQEGWSPPSSSLIPIHPEGSKPPFFCIHGAWGTVGFGLRLARHLGPDQPFYGLQSPGFDGEQDPLTQIEAMASHYVNEIRRVQPQGPYFLGGLSMGGIVAFEVAQQLCAQGQKVALLALLDSVPPVPVSFLRAWVNRSQRAFVYYLIRRFVLHGHNLLQLGLAEQRSYILEKARILRARIASRWPLGNGSIQARHQRDIYPVKVREANIQAFQSYRPQTYPGRITLFLASESPVRSSLDRRMGWRELAVGGLEVCEVAGDHYNMISEPNAKGLAEKLWDCLQKAQAT